MKYIWAFLAALSLAGLVLFFWHSQTKSNPTPPKPETTQTASSEKIDNQPTPTEDIVSEEYSISYDDKQLYGKITAPSDYKRKNCRPLSSHTGLTIPLSNMKCTASCWQSKVIWFTALISTEAAIILKVADKICWICRSRPNSQT